MTTSFTHLIYCPISPTLPLTMLPPEGGIPCFPIIPHEEPLEPEEKAQLEQLQKKIFSLKTNQELCKQHNVRYSDFTFNPVDFALHLQDREAWIIGSQTRPSSIPKHDIDIRFYLENPAYYFDTKAALQQKIATVIAQFIQNMTRHAAYSASSTYADGTPLALKIFDVKIQVFGLPDYPSRPSWALIQLGDMQINAIYRTRTHSLSSSTGGQWNILRAVARWAVGHTFALNAHSFALAKHQAAHRICHIPYPQFTHNLLYRLMLEASHGTVFLPPVDKARSLLALALDKFFSEHARDFQGNVPAVITKNLLRYFTEHARTPHKRLADFLYLLSALQYQPQACALLCRALLEIALRHDKDVHIAAFASFAELLSKHPEETPAFLAVLYGLCICCKWANQPKGAAGEICAYTFFFTEKERAFFTYKGAFFALPADYPSLLDLSDQLLRQWHAIFKYPESAKCLRGLFDFLELSPEYLSEDPSISLKVVKEALLSGAQKEYVKRMADLFHGPDASEAWIQRLKQVTLGESDSKLISGEGRRILAHLGRTSESGTKPGQMEIAVWLNTLGKLGESPSTTVELFKSLNDLWPHIEASPVKSELFDNLKRPLNDFLRYYLRILDKLPVSPQQPPLIGNFYFNVQDFLSREVSLNFFFTLMAMCGKEHLHITHRLIIHGLQSAFFSDGNLRLREYRKLLSSADASVLRQAVQLADNALTDSAHDKVRLDWLPILMQKLFEAKCYSEACALLLHIRRHGKELLVHFLQSDSHQILRKQLQEAAFLDLRSIEPQTIENAYRLLRLILKATPAKALVTEIGKKLSLDMSARFSKSDTPKPDIEVRYHILRLVHQLLYAQAIFSTDTKITCFRYLILKCMETHKRRPNKHMGTSYRTMAMRTLKKMKASSALLSSALQPKPLEPTWNNEVQKTFLLRMKSALTRKIANFHFLGQVLLENILSHKSQKEALGKLLAGHLSPEDLSATFCTFAITLDPSLAEHPAFKREIFLQDHLENIDHPDEKELKEVKEGDEKADPKEEAFIEKINLKQSDATPDFVRLQRVMAWLLNLTSPKGKGFSENLSNSRLFIINSLSRGKKRLSDLSPEARLSLAQSLLNAIKKIFEIPRQDTQNEAFELFAFWVDHSAEYFHPLPAGQADLLAQDSLQIAATLMQEWLLRAKKEPEKARSKALHFLTFFMLKQNVTGGLPYELLIQALALLPRTPPFGLTYPQAVERVRRMIAQSKEEPRTQALLQETALKLIQESLEAHAKNYLSLAVQLCGEILRHRLVVGDNWEVVGKTLQALTEKLCRSQAAIPQESIFHLIVEALMSTQMLSACSAQTRYTVVKNLTDSLFPEMWVKLLSSVKDQLEYLLWRRSCPDTPAEQRFLSVTRLPTSSGLDPVLIDLQATCQILTCLDTHSLDHLNQAMEVYQKLGLDAQPKVLMPMLEGFCAYPKLADLRSDNFGKALESIPRLVSNAVLSPTFWQGFLPKMFYFFDRFKNTSQQAHFDQLELSFAEEVVKDSFNLPPTCLKILVIRLLERALTLSDPVQAQKNNSTLHHLSSRLEPTLHTTCFEGIVTTFIKRELLKSQKMADQLEEQLLKSLLMHELKTFYHRLHNLLRLEITIPVDVLSLAKMVENFFKCAQSLEHPQAFAQMSQLLSLASTEGYFRYLDQEKTSPDISTHLQNSLMHLHFMPLNLKYLEPCKNLDILEWVKKLKNSYKRLSRFPEYKSRVISTFETLAQLFLDGDPQKYGFAMQELEALVKVAYNAEDGVFAAECLSLLVAGSNLYAGIPACMKLIAPKKPRALEKFMRSEQLLPEERSDLPVAREDLKCIMTAMQAMYKSHKTLPQLQKHIEAPDYIKAIKEVCLLGLQGFQRCLLEHAQLPQKFLPIALQRLNRALENIPQLLEGSLPPDEAANLAKKCAAWKAHWALALKNATSGLPLPHMQTIASIPSVCGDISIYLFSLKTRVDRLWKDYRSLQSQSSVLSTQEQLLDQSLNAFIQGYWELLLPARRLDSAEACHIKANNLIRQIERLRQNSSHKESERKVEASSHNLTMWPVIERGEALALHIADLATDLFQTHPYCAQSKISELPLKNTIDYLATYEAELKTVLPETDFKEKFDIFGQWKTRYTQMCQLSLSIKADMATQGALAFAALHYLAKEERAMPLLAAQKSRRSVTPLQNEEFYFRESNNYLLLAATQEVMRLLNTPPDFYYCILVNSANLIKELKLICAYETISTDLPPTSFYARTGETIKSTFEDKRKNHSLFLHLTFNNPQEVTRPNFDFFTAAFWAAFSSAVGNYNSRVKPEQRVLKEELVKKFIVGFFGNVKGQDYLLLPLFDKKVSWPPQGGQDMLHSFINFKGLIPNWLCAARFLSLNGLEQVRTLLPSPLMSPETAQVIMEHKFPVTTFAEFFKHPIVRQFYMPALEAENKAVLLLTSTLMELLEGAKIVEDIFFKKNLGLLLGTSLSKIIEHMQASQNAPALFNIQKFSLFFDLIFEEIALWLSIVEPHAPQKLEKIIRESFCKSSEIKPNLARFTSTGKWCFVEIMHALDQFRGKKLTYMVYDTICTEANCAFDDPFLLNPDRATVFKIFSLHYESTLKEHIERLATSTHKLDVLCMDMPPRISESGSMLKMHDVGALLDELFARNCVSDQALSVVIDNTIGYIDSKEIGDLLIKFKDKIDAGLLNLIIYWDCRTLDTFGTDKFSGGCYCVYSANKALIDIFAAFPANDNGDALSYQGICHLYTYSMPALDHYRKMLFENTAYLHSKILPQCKQALSIPHHLSSLAPTTPASPRLFIDLYAKEDSSPIKTMRANELFPYFPGFGYKTPTVAFKRLLHLPNHTCEKLHVCCGLEDKAGLNRLAQFICTHFRDPPKSTKGPSTSSTSSSSSELSSSLAVKNDNLASLEDLKQIEKSMTQRLKALTQSLDKHDQALAANIANSFK